MALGFLVGALLLLSGEIFVAVPNAGGDDGAALRVNIVVKNDRVVMTNINRFHLRRCRVTLNQTYDYDRISLSRGRGVYIPLRAFGREDQIDDPIKSEWIYDVQVACKWAPYAAAVARYLAPDAGQKKILEVQHRLARQGFEPGPLDGIMGTRTKAAIIAYQSTQQLVADGKITPALIDRLRDEPGPR